MTDKTLESIKELKDKKFKLCLDCGRISCESGDHTFVEVVRLSYIDSFEAGELLREKFNQKRVEKALTVIDEKLKELKGSKGFYWNDEMARIVQIDEYEELRRLLGFREDCKGSLEGEK